MSPVPGEPKNPYVGPRAFREGELFYGRERETSQLINMIIAERIVLLYSPSGAGKTSLIQAALIPRLLKLNFRVMPVVRVNLDPSDALDGDRDHNRYTLSAILSLEERLSAQRQISPRQLAGLSLPEYLAQQPRQEGERDIEVLLFDQFEEILTLDPTDQGAKREFFRQLGEALDARNRWALFSMREDFVTALDPYLLPIPSRFSNTFRLDLLGQEAARQAIQQPARQAGVEFEDAAVKKLVDDLRRVRVQRQDGSTELQLGPYVEPVQLQVVCYRLWDVPRQDPGKISQEDLAAFGQVDQSLVDESLAEYYAQRVAAAAEETGTSERAIREWCDRRLITEGGLRGTVLMEVERSGELDNRAIQRMIHAHLVRAERRGGATWYELAHDRLIAPLRADNRAWFKANLSLLQQQADLWDQGGRLESLLLRGKDLAEAERWASSRQDHLLPAEVDFLSASRSLSERERRTRRLNRLIAIMGLAVIVLALVAFLAYTRAQRATQEAQRQERIARSGYSAQLAARSENILERFPTRSLLLAVEALKVTSKAGDPRQPAAEEALRRALKDPHGLLLAQQTARVAALAFSPDRRWLATGSADGTALLWVLSEAGPAASPIPLSGQEGEVTTLAFSPDGRWLATGSDDHTVRLWELSEAGPAASPTHLSGHDERITSLAFSPDGRWLATGSADATARLWDLNSPDPASSSLTLRGHDDYINTLAISPDGHWLATGSGDSTTRLWNLDSEDPSAGALALRGHARQINELAFSPDGRWLATGSQDGATRLWDLRSEDPAASAVDLGSHEDAVTTLAFSPAGRWLASGSADHTIRLWELGEAGPAASPIPLSGHEERITTLAFSPDGRWLASGSNDHTVRLWELGEASPVSNPTILSGHDNEVTTLAFSPDGRWLATGDFAGTSRIWDMRYFSDASDPAANPVVLTNDEEVRGLAFSPDRRGLAALRGDGSVWTWDLEPLNAGNGQPSGRVSLSGREVPLSSAAFRQDGRLLAAGYTPGGVQLLEIDKAGQAAGDLANPQAGSFVLPDQGVKVSGLAFSPDGERLAAWGSDSTVLLWDLNISSGAASLTTNLAVISSQTPEVSTLALSPDGRWLAIGGYDGSVQIWSLDAAGPKGDPFMLPGHESVVYALAFSPDGRWLASGDLDGVIWLWELSAAGPAENPEVLPGHEDSVRSLVFSPDGRWLASGSGDNTARLWNLEADLPALDSVALSGHEDEVTSLAFSPDGRWLATGSRDGSTRLWLLPLDELASQACRSAGRNFTPEEWQKYFPGEPYRKTCPDWPEGSSGP